MRVMVPPSRSRFGFWGKSGISNPFGAVFGRANRRVFGLAGRPGFPEGGRDYNPWIFEAWAWIPGPQGKGVQLSKMAGWRVIIASAPSPGTVRGARLGGYWAVPSERTVWTPGTSNGNPWAMTLVNGRVVPALDRHSRKPSSVGCERGSMPPCPVSRARRSLHPGCARPGHRSTRDSVSGK